jgi:hypothetical protein
VRSFDAQALAAVLSQYEDHVGDPEMAYDWVANDQNVLLRSDDNFALFDYTYPGMFTAHYFFGSARGREALKLSREMLKTIFLEHGAHVIRGLTPVENKKAAWMTRQLGFTSHDFVETSAGLCEVFLLTLDEFFGADKQHG